MVRRTYYTGFALLVALATLVLARLASAQTPDPNVLEQGRRLYSENCAACHGPQGEGRIGAALAKDWPSIRPDLTVRTIIGRGVQGSVMPAWSQANGGPLSAAEIDALVGYILSWQTGGAPQMTPQPSATLVPPITPIPNVAGDPNHGAVLFAENCAMCHGQQGQGRTGATLAKDWPGIRPDLSIRSTIAGGISGSLMPAWSQTSGGPLGEGDIDDLVAFLLALEGTNPVVQVSPVSPPFIPPGPSPFGGWIGVALFVALFAGIVIAALLLQRRAQR